MGGTHLVNDKFITNFIIYYYTYFFDKSIFIFQSVQFVYFAAFAPPLQQTCQQSQ